MALLTTEDSWFSVSVLDGYRNATELSSVAFGNHRKANNSWLRGAWVPFFGCLVPLEPVSLQHGRAAKLLSQQGVSINAVTPSAIRTSSARVKKQFSQ